MAFEKGCLYITYFMYCFQGVEPYGLNTFSDNLTEYCLIKKIPFKKTNTAGTLFYGLKVRDFHIKHSSTQLGLSTGFVDGTTETSDITFKNFSDVENKKVFCTAKQPKPIDSQEIFNIARKELRLPDVGFMKKYDKSLLALRKEIDSNNITRFVVLTTLLKP